MLFFSYCLLFLKLCGAKDNELLREVHRLILVFLRFLLRAGVVTQSEYKFEILFFFIFACCVFDMLLHDLLDAHLCVIEGGLRVPLVINYTLYFFSEVSVNLLARLTHCLASLI